MTEYEINLSEAHVILKVFVQNFLKLTKTFQKASFLACAVKGRGVMHSHDISCKTTTKTLVDRAEILQSLWDIY